MKVLIWCRNLLLLAVNVALLSSILSSILSCQNLAYAFSAQKIDPELRPYIDTIVKEAKDRGYDLDVSGLSAHIVGFAESETNEDGRKFSIIGMCYPEYFLGNPYIVILPETWKDMRPVKREALVFHEFFHCIMGADHTTDMVQMRDGSVVEASIMSPVIPEAYTLWRHREYYIDELFKYHVDKTVVWQYLKKRTK